MRYTVHMTSRYSTWYWNFKLMRYEKKTAQQKIKRAWYTTSRDAAESIMLCATSPCTITAHI